MAVYKVVVTDPSGSYVSYETSAREEAEFKADELQEEIDRYGYENVEVVVQEGSYVHRANGPRPE